MKRIIGICLLVLITSVVCFLSGYLIGKSEEHKEVDVERESVVIRQSIREVRDTIRHPEPYAVYQNKEILVRDTIEQMVLQDVDTAAILHDYNLVRKYSVDFSNDSIGTFKVKAIVSNNKLLQAVSEIRPNERVVTRELTYYKVKAMQFYVSGGTSFSGIPTQKLQLGADIKQKYLIGVSGVRLGDSYGYTIDFGVKF